MLAGCLMAICVVLFFMMRATDETTGQPQESKNKTTRLRNTDRKQRASIDRENRPATNSIEVHRASVPTQREYTVVSAITNGGQIVERRRGSDGKFYKVIRYNKPIFEFASDRTLSMLTSGDGINAPPPMPMIQGENLEASFVESLKKPIVINDDDPEDIVRLKERIINAREDVDALMKQGMGFNEIVAEYQRQMRDYGNLRHELQKELNRIAEEGDMEGARAYHEKMNEQLKGMGIAELEMPLSRSQVEELILNEAQQKEMKNEGR